MRKWIPGPAVHPDCKCYKAPAHPGAFAFSANLGSITVLKSTGRYGDAATQLHRA